MKTHSLYGHTEDVIAILRTKYSMALPKPRPPSLPRVETIYLWLDNLDPYALTFLRLRLRSARQTVGGTAPLFREGERRHGAGGGYAAGLSFGGGRGWT